MNIKTWSKAINSLAHFSFFFSALHILFRKKGSMEVRG